MVGGGGQELCGLKLLIVIGRHSYKNKGNNGGLK